MSATNSTPVPSFAPRSLRRRLAYSAAAASLALLLLVTALELGLRLAGFGDSPHFARRETLRDGTAVWRENRACTAPYFGRERVRRPQPFSLPVQKPPRTYRIFVLGSSAAMGDPEASFSIARVLQTLLTAAHPGVHFEVVNAGITAINSHVLRGIAEDCAALGPDLFIVYEGNNEVIGPFGPAEVFAPFFQHETATRLAAAMSISRTGQLVRRLLGRSGDDRAKFADWGGMQMFLDRQLSASDPRLDVVCTHFADNLRAITAAGRHAGAPVLLCTVLTNQRDFAPFLSRHRPGLSADERARWQSQVDDATAALRRGDRAAAERAYRAALAIDDSYAELPFRLGRLLLEEGRDDDAAELLRRAADLDTLRFRTDSRLNQVIRAVAASTPNAELVDLARELALHSAHGVVGDDLLYEHVHLTFRGTYEVALRLFGAVSVQLRERGLGAAEATPLALDDVRERLAFTTYDQAMIGLELLRRFRAPPFTAQPDDANRIAAWERRLAGANSLLERPDATDALLAVYSHAMALTPTDWLLRRNAGEMLVARGRPADALPLLEAARQAIPDDADTLVALGLAHRALGHERDADAMFEQVRRLEPRHPLLPPPAKTANR